MLRSVCDERAFLSLCNKAGLSSVEAGELLGTEPSRIASYESGELAPSPREIQVLKGLCIISRPEKSKISSAPPDIGLRQRNERLGVATQGPNIQDGTSSKHSTVVLPEKRKAGLLNRALPRIFSKADSSMDKSTSLQRPESTKRYKFVTLEKSGGVTYTPPNLANFVAQKIIEKANLNRGLDRPLRVIDPAVGDGALLLSLLGCLTKRTKYPITVFGFDTSQEALNEAGSRISCFLPAANIFLEKGNFLEFVPNNYSEPSLFSKTNSQLFDLVIANPPYVRTQIMGSEQAQRLGAAFGLTGRVDLYHAFLVGISKVLCSTGTAGIIVSNRFMSTRSGSSVRAALRANFALRHIWDLGDTKLFDAAVLPAVILAEGLNGYDPRIPEFTTIYETKRLAANKARDPIAALSMAGVVAIDDGRRFQVRHGSLSVSGPATDLWRIATDSADAWLTTVSAHSWGTFRDIGKIRVGVKTCADQVFIRDDWSKVPDAQRPELLRPVTTHHNGARFRSTPSTTPRAILYPHEVVNGRRQAIDLRQYPKSRSYLELHRSVLQARGYVIEAGRRWYEIWVPQDPDLWSAPKLVFRDICERPTFWLDLNGTIVNGDCYWLTPERTQPHELLWLAAAVANSTFAEEFYDRRFNNKLYSGRRRFITQYVEQFPLPDPSTSLARQIVATAKAIYEAADRSKAETLEQDSNTMIWRAFGLGVEEICR
jgi:hypothetical protein